MFLRLIEIRLCAPRSVSIALPSQAPAPRPRDISPIGPALSMNGFAELAARNDPLACAGPDRTSGEANIAGLSRAYSSYNWAGLRPKRARGRPLSHGPRGASVPRCLCVAPGAGCKLFVLPYGKRVFSIGAAPILSHWPGSRRNRPARSDRAMSGRRTGGVGWIAVDWNDLLKRPGYSRHRYRPVGIS
jgi:hypothetical protein